MCSGTFSRREEKLSESISETITLIKTVTVYSCDSCGQVAEKFVSAIKQVEVEPEEETDAVEST